MAILIRSANRPGSTSPIAANVVTITQTTATLAQYASEDFLLGLSKAGVIAGVQADRSCLVRIYSSAATRSADTRAYNVAVPSAGVAGLIAEVEIDTTASSSIDTNVIYANSDTPQEAILYAKVINLGTSGTVQVAVRAVQYLEEVPLAQSDTQSVVNMIVAAALG